MSIEKLLRESREKADRRRRDLAATIREASSEDGRITARFNAHRLLVGLRIDPELLRGEVNRGWLGEQVRDVANAALEEIEAYLRDRFGKIDWMPELDLDPESFLSGS